MAGSEEFDCLGKLMDGQLAENEAATEALKTMNGCRIRSNYFGNKMWVQVYSRQLANKIDDDMKVKTTSISYKINGFKKYDNSLAVLAEHPIIRNAESKKWQMTIEHTKRNSLLQLSESSTISFPRGTISSSKEKTMTWLKSRYSWMLKEREARPLSMSSGKTATMRNDSWRAS